MLQGYTRPIIAMPNIWRRRPLVINREQYLCRTTLYLAARFYFETIISRTKVCQVDFIIGRITVLSEVDILLEQCVIHTPIPIPITSVIDDNRRLIIHIEVT
jgi:hypothetical protein